MKTQWRQVAMFFAGGVAAYAMESFEKYGAAMLAPWLFAVLSFACYCYAVSGSEIPHAE